ncbi:hypothetical protein HQ587_04605 [bacterium]|nr:hypothetical protein [bacterium]
MYRTSTGLFLLLLLLFIVQGCATFRTELGGRFTQPTELNYGAEKVSVLFVFSHLRQTTGYDAIPKLDSKRRVVSGFYDIFNDALSELNNIESYATFTNYASDVNEPERRALRDSLVDVHDFVMEIEFRRTKSFAKHFLGSLFSTLLVTILPIPYTESYSVTLDVYGSEGHLIKRYNRDASTRKWVQALLIFVYPFHPEKRKMEEIYVDFLHDIFRQIETEKVLALN